MKSLNEPVTTAFIDNISFPSAFTGRIRRVVDAQTHKTDKTHFVRSIIGYRLSFIRNWPLVIISYNTYRAVSYTHLTLPTIYSV